MKYYNKLSIYMKTICVITGTRADYGLLKGVIKDIEQSSNFNLLLFVTGSHLEKKYGNTYNCIEKDGFIINEKIKMDLNSDSPEGILYSMSKELQGLAKCFNKYQIDLVLILGDRYEMLIAAQVALIYNIDIAHLCGGDITQGAYDDSIRNSITNMAKFHFVTCKSSYNNVINMGENQKNVHLVGNPGLYDIKKFIPMKENIFYAKLNILKRDRLIFVVNHSETLLSSEENNKNMNILCDALLNINDFDKTNIVFIHSNADNCNKYIFKKINDISYNYVNIYAFISLERNLYLNIIHYCDVFIGNSSSGIYEVPLFKKITFNLGNRQKGRECGNSVINLEYNKGLIISQLNNIPLINNWSYPYDTMNTSKEILRILSTSI